MTHPTEATGMDIVSLILGSESMSDVTEIPPSSSCVGKGDTGGL